MRVPKCRRAKPSQTQPNARQVAPSQMTFEKFNSRPFFRVEKGLDRGGLLRRWCWSWLISKYKVLVNRLVRSLVKWLEKWLKDEWSVRVRKSLKIQMTIKGHTKTSKINWNETSPVQPSAIKPKKELRERYWMIQVRSALIVTSCIPMSSSPPFLLPSTVLKTRRYSTVPAQYNTLRIYLVRGLYSVMCCVQTR